MTLLDSINIGGSTYGITGAAVLGASSTPAGSEVKVCTFTDGFELKAGNLFLIKFTYANTYGDGVTTYPKLQVNGTNYVMRRADGNYVQSGEWGNNATLTFLFDGTDFILPAGSATGSASVPLGSIIAIYSNSVPDGYLPCNGVQFDTAQFAALYALLGDDHTPDLRECALVGIGHNGTDIFDNTETDPSTGQAGTQNHDEYTLGQFKDDALKSHSHDIKRVPYWYHYSSASLNGTGGGNFSYLNDGTTGITENAGSGNITRGKRKGVNYIIKATSGLPDSQQDYILNQLAPVDQVAVGNVHSVTSNAVAQYARKNLYASCSFNGTSVIVVNNLGRSDLKIECIGVKDGSIYTYVAPTTLSSDSTPQTITSFSSRQLNQYDSCIVNVIDSNNNIIGSGTIGYITSNQMGLTVFC